MYLFGAALVVFVVAGVGAPVQAQPVCGWCSMDGDYVGSIGGWDVYANVEHAFLDGGNACGLEGRDAPSIGGGPFCSRCGGTSDCHTEWRDGPCHRACGPLGDLFSALTDVEDALEIGDFTAVAAALREPREGFSFEFIPEAGRIEVVRSCTPGRAFAEIPVLPEARRRLQAAVALRAAWSAG